MKTTLLHIFLFLIAVAGFALVRAGKSNVAWFRAVFEMPLHIGRRFETFVSGAY